MESLDLSKFRALLPLETLDFDNGRCKMKGKPFDDLVADLLRDDPALAVEMLNSTLLESDQGELLSALRQMTVAFYGVQKIAEEVHLYPPQL